MLEKIREALDYIEAKRERMYNGELIDMEEVRNDAANIFADTLEEYNAIWEAIGRAR